ncbi:MAG: hypothetical protein EAZ81_10175 [Verrucomicrobia bacterium]|nr:MAG: hypothetical protein EAZ81_10175 [Verrucomicrobiota bacterium]
MHSAPLHAEDKRGDVGGADQLVDFSRFWRGRSEVSVSVLAEGAVGIRIPSVADAQMLAGTVVKRHAGVVVLGAAVRGRIGHGVSEIQRAGVELAAAQAQAGQGESVVVADQLRARERVKHRSMGQCCRSTEQKPCDDGVIC